MNNYFPPSMRVFACIGCFASLSIASHAVDLFKSDAEALTSIGVRSEDKICVISENTGLSMWYNARNHGFTEAWGNTEGASFASTLDVMFGEDHQLTPATFDNASVYSINPESTYFNKLVSQSTLGLGSPVGCVFAKDGQLYLSEQTPQCDLKIADSTGVLAEAVLNSGVVNREKLNVVALTTAPVPEPSSYVLLGAAGAAFAVCAVLRRLTAVRA